MGAEYISPKARAQLGLLENPYAFIDFEDHKLEEAPLRGRKGAQVGQVQIRQADLFSSPPMQPSHSYGPLSAPRGNPYARIAQGEADDANEESPQVDDSKIQSLSKAEFRKRCTEIFRQYIPELDGKGLRGYMRDFIIRNESRMPRVRFLLVKSLGKFDLSDLLGATPLFNREDESLSEQKLRDVERSVGEEG
jgi:hypothetical protein